MKSSAYDPSVFALPESLDREAFLEAAYYVESDSPDLLKKAGAIAVGQTTGGWVELPHATRELLEAHVGRLTGLTEVPPGEAPLGTPTGERRFLARVSFPLANLNRDIASLLTAVFGKVSMDGKIKLVDLIFPRSFAESLPGPKFGIPGVRARLKADSRPILMSIFKPCIGLTPEQLGELFYEQAAGGVDLVKDDEILSDSSLDQARARLEACLEAAERASRQAGKPVLYALNLTGPAMEIPERARLLVREGATCFLLNVLAYGFPLLEALARDAEVSVPLMAHPAVSGAMTPAEAHGIASPVLLGKLMRLAGADMVLYPSPYGTVAVRKEIAVATALALSRPLYAVKPAFPVPSAGITPGLVPQILADFGTDVIVNAGGGVHGHPKGATAGARAFVQAIEASLAGRPLAQAAERAPELAAALSLWGPR